MGFSVQKIEYMTNTWAQDSGSRALGNTGSYNYWTRITVRTDDYGCSSLNAYLDAICYDGAVNQYYSAGAQLIVSTSSTPGSYTGSSPNLAATYMGNNQQRWTFSGSVSVSMAANTVYYIFILPCWSNPDTFVRYLQSDASVSAAAAWPNYSLGISAGAGSSASVYRSASPAGAPAGNLGNGAVIFYGDTLVISFAAVVGYQLTSHTVNGDPFTSGASMTVTGGVTVSSTATRLAYTLTYSADGGSTVKVTRGGEELASGATIYYGDTLTVTAEAKAGYEIASATINGTAFTSPKSLSVTGAVAVVVTSSALGFVYIRRSGAWVPYLIYIRRSGAWVRYRAYIRRSGAWVSY